MDTFTFYVRSLLGQRYISFASYREYIRSWFMIMILITTYGLALWGTQCHTGVGNRKGRNKRGSPEDTYGLSLSNGLCSSPYVCIWSMIISIIHYMPSYNHNQCHHTQPTSLAHPRQATFPPIGTVTTARSTITTWLLWGSSSWLISKNYHKLLPVNGVWLIWIVVYEGEASPQEVWCPWLRPASPFQPSKAGTCADDDNTYIQTKTTTATTKTYDT